MALLQRLFQNRRNAKQYNRSYYGEEESNSSTGNQQQTKLDKKRIRLLIIAENEKGRVPYFDSNAIHRVEEKPVEQKKGCKATPKLVPGVRQPKEPTEQVGFTGKNGEKYRFDRLGSEVKMLEEMMFGAVAMSYKGSTIKVHHIRSPPQLVVTKVFYPQKPKPDSMNTEGDIDSQPGSLSSSYDHLGLGDAITPTRRSRTNQVMSIPVDVPMLRESLTDSTDDDSGLYSLTSSGSFQSMFPSPSNSSANSYNSLHRRWMRSQTTSLQRRWDSQETLNSYEASPIPKKKQIKLAIGILFSTSDCNSTDEEKDNEEYRQFQSFFFAHMALIEGHVEALQGSVERAIFTGRNMMTPIFEALDQFRDAMYDLYMGPRLDDPVWLSMMCGKTRYNQGHRFLNEFMFLVSKHDNKATKFFVSTLLSAVLTYHLAWVATVTPSDGTPSQTYLEKHSPKWIDALTKTHPYNPLWAQLGDMYGAIGNPLRVARTVVVGRKADLVKKFLYVLSYFIRCSDVHEESFANCLPTILESHCWLNPVPSRTASAEDGSITNLIESGSTLSDMFTPLTDSGNLTTCSSCGSCTSLKRAFSSDSTQNCEGDRTPAGWLMPQQQCQCGTKPETGHRHDTSQCGSQDQRHQAGQSSDNKLHCDSDSKLGTLGSISTLNSDNWQNVESQCREFAAQIEEDSRLENVYHVRRSVEKALAELPEDFRAVSPVADSKPELSSNRSLSMLAQQLADSEAVEKQKANMREFKKQFLNGGSNSFIEEYLNGDVETKTIDDVSEHQIVVKHPLARSCTTSPSPGQSGRGKGVDNGVASQQPSKISVSRQSSVDTKTLSSRTTPLPPARCRSVTPTELERRRHLSSTSSIDPDMFDPLLHCQEISMPITPAQPEQVEVYDKNFGRSLLGGYSDHYMSDFVLHGTSDTSFRPKLLHDIQNTLQHSILDEPVAESVCIIADTDNWTVEVANSRLLEMSSTGVMSWTTSQLVVSLIESVFDLHRLKMSAEFCIMHLEDRLQEMYFKSLMLAEYIKVVKTPNQQHLSAMLGFDASDLPLLLSVAGTHTPNLALGAEARARNSYSS